MKQTLEVTQETFISMLPGLIGSGVTFTAQETAAGIIVTFTGGY